jgi:hypothetical protein
MAELVRRLEQRHILHVFALTGGLENGQPMRDGLARVFSMDGK